MTLASERNIDKYETEIRENGQDECLYHTGDIHLVHLMDKDYDKMFHLATLSRILPSFNKPEETHLESMQQVLKMTLSYPVRGRETRKFACAFG